MDDHGRSPSSNQPILYVLDTNVLIHDPNALLNFEEHHVAIPMTVLEELDEETPCPRIAGRRSAGRRPDGAARRALRIPHGHAPLLSGCFR